MKREQWLQEAARLERKRLAEQALTADLSADLSSEAQSAKEEALAEGGEQSHAGFL